MGRLALKLETWDRTLNLHPGILDGAFQLLLLACPRSHSFLPFSVDSCILATTFPADMWVTARVHSVSDEAICGDVEICTDDGILVARVTRAMCRVQPQHQEQLAHLMYHVAFLAAEPPSYALPGEARALVWTSDRRKQQLLAALGWKLEQCQCVADTSALTLLGSLAQSLCWSAKAGHFCA